MPIDMEFRIDIVDVCTFIESLYCFRSMHMAKDLSTSSIKPFILCYKLFYLNINYVGRL